MKELKGKSNVRLVGFRLAYEEAERLHKEFEDSSFKRKADFMREIYYRGLKSFKDSQSS